MEQNGINQIKDKVERLFNDAIKGTVKGKPISIGVLTLDGRRFLEELSSLKFKGKVDFVLNPSDLVHIHNDHFESNEKDMGNNIPLTINDVKNIVDVVLQPDNVIYFKEKEENGNGRKLFYLLKDVDDGTYNLLEVYTDKKGNLTAKTFYKTKKDTARRVMMLENILLSTSETYSGGSLLTAKVPQLFDLPTDSE